MKLSGVIDALIASGGTPQQIAAVIRAAEADEQAIADARREKAASKKRAQRASEQLSRFVQGTDGDKGGHKGTDGDAGGHDTPLLSSSEIDPPSPPMGALPPKGQKRNRGGSLPADWQPKDRHFARASEVGLNGSFIGDLANRMREWAGANSNRAIARKADWDLTFDGFIRRELEKRQPARAGPIPRHERGNPAVEARQRILAAGGDLF